MSGQLEDAVDRTGGDVSDALLESAADLVGTWPALLAGEGGPAVPPEESERFVRAVATALAGDDIAPLAALAGVDARGDTPGMTHRLDLVLRALDALRRALVARRPHAADAVATAFAALSRQLAVQAVATLGGRLTDDESTAASVTTSLAVTLHELRRPLTVLSSYSQLLGAGALGDLPDRAVAAVTSMTNATETMMRLVEALTELNRLEDPFDRPTLREVDVLELVSAATAEVMGVAELRGVRVVADVEPGLSVHCDRDRLVLALTNLMSNAVKHAPDRSEVEVTGRHRGRALLITVRDYGPGFPPGEADLLFDKYYRTASEREAGVAGTGLGLYIVRAVVERHGGTVVARSAEDGGAEFEMVLPAG